MNKIIIEVIPHEEQKYSTVGDWYTDKNECDHITVSSMDNDDYERLVALHEFIEAWLCKRESIDERDVTEFDKQYEANRELGNTNEAGNDPKAPYRKQHQIATTIERTVSEIIGVDWDKYDEAVNAL